ncbi:MAG: hypothetical protein ACI9O3_000025 [Colwellia sp.]|jgi:hypothetical protein
MTEKMDFQEKASYLTLSSAVVIKIKVLINKKE